MIFFLIQKKPFKEMEVTIQKIDEVIHEINKKSADNGFGNQVLEILAREERDKSQIIRVNNNRAK